MTLILRVCVETIVHWKHGTHNVSLMLRVCVETMVHWKHGAYNVSRLLDSLLKDYDNSLRPDFEGMKSCTDPSLQKKSN